jgi:transposase
LSTGQTSIVKATAAGTKRVSLTALICIQPGRGSRKGSTEADYARLFDAAHQQLDGPIVIIWDNLNTRVSIRMKELTAARDWLGVLQLPFYAPELNPVEAVWSHLKRSLANLAERGIDQLTSLVKTRLKRMQYQPALTEGYLAKTGLDPTPL